MPKEAVTSPQATGLDRNKTAIGFQSAHRQLEVLWKQPPLPTPFSCLLCKKHQGATGRVESSSWRRTMAEL